jgi:hypothetical protein
MIKRFETGGKPSARATIVFPAFSLFELESLASLRSLQVSSFELRASNFSP